MPRTRALSAIALVIAVAGCGSDPGSPTGAAGIPGTYALRRINGVDLPYTDPTLLPDSNTLLAGSITLAPDGSARSTSTYSRRARGASVATVMTSTSLPLRWVADGDTLVRVSIAAPETGPSDALLYVVGRDTLVNGARSAPLAPLYVRVRR